MSDWTLAIASSGKAELEVATENENFGLVDIFGLHTAKTIQSKDIEFYQRQSKRKRPCFFRGKKIGGTGRKARCFYKRSIDHGKIQGQDEWASGFFDCDFNYDHAGSTQIKDGTQPSLLDMLQTNQLNPNTALQYFKWASANLDDVEKLFLSYGGQ